jgi:sulfotransferase
MKEILFNSSIPRGGSELLQVILSQNDKIYASATSPLLEYQYGARANFNLNEVKSQNPTLMKNAFTSMCSGMAQSYYDAITDKPVVIDKSRGWISHLEWVEQWKTNPKVICMIRDLRSVLASFENVYRNNRGNPDCIDNPSEIKNMTADQRARYWANSKPVGISLASIKDLFMRNRQSDVCFVKYEALVQNPDETMDAIYKYLELDSFKHDFNNLEKKVEENSSLYGIFGNHDVRKELKSTSHWVDTYPEWIGNQIYEENKWYFETFGYSKL